jgi:stage V sporulation protein R
MMGIEYLWGGPVHLETSEVVSISPAQPQYVSTDPSTVKQEKNEEQEIKWQRVVYTMKDRKLSKKTI